MVCRKLRGECAADWGDGDWIPGRAGQVVTEVRVAKVDVRVWCFVLSFTLCHRFD
jgi:hypothetical protein